MPTPNAYTHPDWNPFAEVPAALQGDEVPVLYITDRVPEKQTPDGSEYGYKRSRSAAFGESVVRIGDGQLTWDEIVEASRVSKRSKKLELTVIDTRELARFAQTPPSLVVSDAQMAQMAQLMARGGTPPVDPVQAEAEGKFKDELAARLAQSPRKEVFIFVHGFNNTFDDAVLTTAELWHFLGREGVPICYTWPASTGLFGAYEYTLASTQFTVYHFKQALRLIASCPEVEKVNIIAHSRGTAVTTDTVRELFLELRGTTDAQKALKLDTVILAAADIDLDVAIERNGTERIARATEAQRDLHQPERQGAGPVELALRRRAGRRRRSEDVQPGGDRRAPSLPAVPGDRRPRESRVAGAQLLSHEPSGQFGCRAPHALPPRSGSGIRPAAERVQDRLVGDR